MGLVYLRVGNWKEAVVAIRKSMDLREGGEGDDWFLLAMALWRLGERDEARTWHDRAVEWMSRKCPRSHRLKQIRAEATTLLGMAAPPSTHQQVGPPPKRD